MLKGFQLSEILKPESAPLSKINVWTNHRKLILQNLNPVPNKKVQDVSFSPKFKKIFYLPLNFNNNVVKHVLLYKHLEVYLDGRLGFCEHLQNILSR